MISERTLCGVVYACVLLIVLCALAGVGDLTWKGHVQVAVVLTGLLVLYRRHRDGLGGSRGAGEDEASAGPARVRAAAALASRQLTRAIRWR